MNEKTLYPKTIKDLYSKIDYIMKNDEDTNKIKELEEWLNWSKKIDNNHDIKLRENEYLKAFHENKKYALQVWRHTNIVDSVVTNLISNHYSVYNSEYTIILK